MSERRAQRGLPRVAITLAASAAVAALATTSLVPPIVVDALAEEDGAAREVVRTTSGFSVHANSSEMPRLLSALGAEAGFTVLDTGKFQLPVTFSLDDAPLDMTLRRMLRDANFIIVYRGGKRGTEISSEGIEQIILLSPAGVGAPKPPPPGSPLAGPHIAGGAPNAQGQPVPPAVRARRLRARDVEAAAANAEAYPPGLAPNPAGAYAPNIPMPPEIAGVVPEHPTHEELTEQGSIGMAGAVGAGVIETNPPDDASLDDEE